MSLDFNALQERYKELTCLYELVQLYERPYETVAEILKLIPTIVRKSFWCPEFTSIRIKFDGEEFISGPYTAEGCKASRNLFIKNEKRGTIEVCLLKNKHGNLEILDEEISLLNAVSHQIGILIENKEALQLKNDLRNQLRHAERLATVGTVSSCIAHEINEPLAAILGYAQLLQKNDTLSNQGKEDLENIVKAALHARDVIRGLNFYTGKEKQQASLCVDLNQTINHELFFLENVCRKNAIHVTKNLAKRLPCLPLTAVQLQQVLVNTIMNSVQAMPNGGTITICTYKESEYVVLQIKDEGTGMSDEVKSNIFNPFYTTKSENDGTGLGLSIVKDILNSCSAEILVQTEVDMGTEITIRFPKSSMNDYHKEKVLNG
jgi:signal transduction histidine kinase